jgi:hypothetical protein
MYTLKTAWLKIPDLSEINTVWGNLMFLIIFSGYFDHGPG